MTRDTHLLPGHQIWGLTPGFAATFWTGFSFQKIFRERLFSGIADYRRDAYWPVCEEPASVDQVAHSTPPDLTPHRRDITPTRQEEMGCAAETRQGVKLSGRCFDDESHDKDCNRDGATEVGNVRVESFHAASAGYRSLLFFLWPMAKA